jgi:hypothetical protein
VALFTDWGISGSMLAGLQAGADFVVIKDLVTRPEDWLARIGELLDLVRGRSRPWFPQPRRSSLPSSSPAAGLAGIVRALRHPSLRDIPHEVLSWSLRHAWVSALSVPVPLNLDTWTLPGTPAPPGSLLAAEDTAVLALAFAQRIWCLLGTTASAPFREALAATYPEVRELLQP